MVKASCRFILHLGAAILAGVTVLAGVCAWRLGQGPVSIGFLTPSIERLLNANDRGVRVEIASTALSWDAGSDAVEILASQVHGFRRDGSSLVTLPGLALTLDVRALLQEQLAPRRLDIIGLAVHAVRTPEGGLSLGIAAPDQTPKDAPAAAADPDRTALFDDLVAALRRPPGGPGPIGRLREFSLAGGSMTVEDRRLGLTWSVPRAAIDIRRDDDGLRGHVRLAVDLGSRTAGIEAGFLSPAAGKATTVSARIDGLDPAALAARVPALAMLAGVHTAVTARVEATLDPALLPASGSLDLAAAAGEAVDPRLWPGPVAFKGFHLKADFDRPARRLRILNGVLDLDGPGITFSGEATASGDPEHLEIEGHGDIALRDVPVDRLPALWPAALAPKPRRWIVENLGAGVVDEASARFAATVPLDRPDDADLASLSGAMRFHGVDVTYFQKLPRVTGLDGTARFDARSLTVMARGGHVLDLHLGDSQAVITGLDSHDQAIALTVAVAGPLRSALTLLDQPPLGYPGRLGLKPAGTGGSFTSDLSFRFPLRDALTPEEILFGAKARLTGVMIPDAVAHRDVAAGELALSLTPERMKVDGTATLDGIPLTVAWREALTRQGDTRTRIEARGTVDEAARTRLGLDTAPWLTGPVGVETVYTVGRDGRSRMADKLDLGAATLALAPLGWVKPAGTAATGQGTVEIEGNRAVRLTDLGLDAPGLHARGQVDLAPVRVRLDTLTAGATRLAGTVTATGQGWRAVLAGPCLDATALLAPRTPEPHHTDAGPRRFGPPFPLDLSLTTNTLTTGPGRGLADLALTGAWDGTAWTRMSLDASTGPDRPLRLRYGLRDGQRRLDLTVADAGAMLRSFDITDKLRGGRLTVTGAGDGPGPLRGRIGLDDFTVLRAPLLARLLDAVSPTGLANLLSGDGLRFSRLESDFRWARGVLALAGLHTAGAALGMTAEGRIDVDAGAMDLQGTLVPVYFLNRLLGHIPLLGDLLSGGDGQGVFAATYHLRGALEDPTVSVNPLAVLAPGFLRNLFFLGEDPGRAEK